MPRKTADLLGDMHAAAVYIRSYTLELDWQASAGDEAIQSVIERKLLIIGEALFQMTHRDPATAAKITDFQRIVSMRHVLVHGYHTVRWAVRRDTVQLHLPLLIQELKSLLSEARA